jgi:outer membrane lipoprotein-sorting protein
MGPSGFEKVPEVRISNMTHAIALPVFLALVTGAAGEPTTSDIVQRGLHDMSFTAYNVKGDQSELAKINKDFAESFRFSSVKIWAKEPFKLRLESRVKDTDVLYVLNGTTRIYSIPRIKMHQREDLSRGPGKRQTWLDFGLLTSSLLQDLFDAKFVRVDRATHDYVFDLSYGSDYRDTSRHRIWVDPERKYITKREWFNQKGVQLATFFYEDPKEVDGIWVPTKVTVKNVDNVVAGVTEYGKIKVNSGLSESLFDVD